MRSAALQTSVELRAIHVTGDFSELVQRRVQILDDLLGNLAGRGKVVGVLEALVAEPEDVEADLVALDQFVVAERPPAPVGLLGLVPGRLALVAIGWLVA